MKKVIIGVLTALLLCFSGLSIGNAYTTNSEISSSSISRIERKGNFYNIYDESGKLIKSKSTSIGELIGWGTNYFIVTTTSFYDLYDMYGNKYKSLSKDGVGTIISVSSSTFSARKHNFITTYDSSGKRINSTPVR